MRLSRLLVCFHMRVKSVNFNFTSLPFISLHFKCCFLYIYTVASLGWVSPGAVRPPAPPSDDTASTAVRRDTRNGDTFVLNPIRGLPPPSRSQRCIKYSGLKYKYTYFKLVLELRVWHVWQVMFHPAAFVHLSVCLSVR